MLTLYDFSPSGNCYKVRLLLSQLGVPYRRVEIDRVGGETRLPAFLEKNPNGKVPVLELESGERLPESNAILFYLSQGTRFFPNDRFQQAQALQWMFFEQYSHMPNIAVARYWISILKKEQEYEGPLKEKHALGYHALGVMEGHLQKRRFFVGEAYSVADISLYAYTHVAEAGKFELSRFPAVQAWLRRVEDQPNYVPLA